MPAAAFVVFQDTPSTPSKSSSSSNPQTPSSPSSSLVPATTLTEKENLHPLTGERAAASSTACKKRKTAHGVLATKLYLAPTSKKQKESKNEGAKSEVSTKKRKSTKGKSKEPRRSGSSGTRSARRVSPLPKVDEDVELERERIAQAEIDSRCYDLTVLPLADVTPAYESPAAIDRSEGDNAKLRSVKEPSAEPEIRDYFSPSLSTASLLGCSQDTSKLIDRLQETKSFSTPERKRIYAAFTFSSPSPSAERFSKSNGSVGGIEFTPATP